MNDYEYKQLTNKLARARALSWWTRRLVLTLTIWLAITVVGAYLLATFAPNHNRKSWIMKHMFGTRSALLLERSVQSVFGGFDVDQEGLVQSPAVEQASELERA